MARKSRIAALGSLNHIIVRQANLFRTNGMTRL